MNHIPSHAYTRPEGRHRSLRLFGLLGAKIGQVPLLARRKSLRPSIHVVKRSLNMFDETVRPRRVHSVITIEISTSSFPFLTLHIHSLRQTGGRYAQKWRRRSGSPSVHWTTSWPTATRNFSSACLSNPIKTSTMST